MAAQRYFAIFGCALLSACSDAIEPPRDPAPIIEQAKPAFGAAGTPVVISGQNLDAPSLAAVFNGVATKPVEKSSAEAKFHVPSRARSGNLILRTSGGASAPVPFEIAQRDNDGWAGVSAASRHTCGIKSDGALLCWGDNRAQQLAFAEALPAGYPRKIELTLKWLAVHGGLYLDRGNTCAIAAGGGLWCWGDNTAAQFGDGSKVSSGVPVKAGGRVSSWSQLTLGAYHACGLSGEKLYCWGTFTSTYSGNGQVEPDPLLVTPPAGQTGWSFVAAGSLHSCAVAQPSGLLYCWGANAGGQLGDGTTQDSASPVAVQSALRWRSVAGSSYIGSGATCAIAENDALYCWGSNSQRQLGDGSGIDRAAPVKLSGTWSAVTLGKMHTCAISTAGELYCWGGNRHGQTGSLQLTKPASTPALVNADTDWAAVSAGGEHTCALKTSGDLYCWGNNEDGQVGRYTFEGYDARPALVAHTFP